jgi:hypothetical protein
MSLLCRIDPQKICFAWKSSAEPLPQIKDIRRRGEVEDIDGKLDLEQSGSLLSDMEPIRERTAL